MPCIQASVKRLKEHVYNRLENIPYDYVMKDDAPERIPLGTGAAVGPSVVSVDARQPNSIADNLEAYEGYQGAGAADNFHSDGFNLVTEPIYTHANYGPMNSGPLNTYDCQGQGIPPPCQQQITLPSIGPEWQQNAQVSEDSPDPFEVMQISTTWPHFLHIHCQHDALLSIPCLQEPTYN
jgi:hypothetical protein